MYGEEKFDDYLKANPEASYSELQSKMEEILNERFDDYQSGPEDFEEE